MTNPTILVEALAGLHGRALRRELMALCAHTNTNPEDVNEDWVLANTTPAYRESVGRRVRRTDQIRRHRNMDRAFR